jgi:hypothetical protein
MLAGQLSQGKELKRGGCCKDKCSKQKYCQDKRGKISELSDKKLKILYT